MSDIIIKILQANHGDSLLIKFRGDDKKNHNILIDGGIYRTYNTTLRHEVEQIVSNGEFIDLVVITHIDEDHIGGIIRLVEAINKDEFEYNPVQKFWFNSLETIQQAVSIPSTKISFIQGNTLASLLQRTGRWQNECITISSEIEDIGGAKLTILSPTIQELQILERDWEAFDEESSTPIGSQGNDYQETIEELLKRSHRGIIEDTSITNASSIALFFECMGKSALFLGDSHPSVVVRTLKELGKTKENKLRVDCVKLSHHGSKGNTDFELLNLIDCQQFIISTNGAKNLPDKETLARVLGHVERGYNPETGQYSKDISFIFNYENQNFQTMFSDSETSQYNFQPLFKNEIEL